MRQLCRVYRRPDNGISVVYPSWDDEVSGFGKTLHTTEQEWYDWAVTKGISPDWINLGDFDRLSLPSRDFREQWRWDGTKVHIDPVLETEERWRRIRSERDLKLKDSDISMLRSLEINVKVQEWKAYRQSLRDIPQSQSNPKSIVWPEKPA